MVHWQYTPYILPLASTAVVSVILVHFAWRRRPAPGAVLLALLMLAVTVWLAGYALELACVDLPDKVFWAKVQYLGIVVVPLIWLLFALCYTDRGQWLTRRNLLLSSVVPTITALLVWTNDLHGLIWREVGLHTHGLFATLDLTYGPWFWVHTAYSYLLLFLGTFILLQMRFLSPQVYRRQSEALLIAALAPWVGNVLHISGLTPFPHLDLTPFAFTLTGLALAWGLFRYQLLDMMPVACEAIIEGMSGGVIVLDVQDRIVSLNQAAVRIIGASPSEAVGQSAAHLLPGWRDLAARLSGADEERIEVGLGAGETRRSYDLHCSPLHDRRGRATGRLVVLYDVTERRQADQQLRVSSTALESAANAIVITDREGRITWVNPAFSWLTGYTLEDALGRNPRLLKSGQHDLAFYHDLWETLLSGKVWIGEFVNRRKDGSLYIEEQTITPVQDERGEISHFIGIKQDITARKQAEAEREKLIEELDAFAHTVAHDLKGPLALVLGYAETLVQYHLQMNEETKDKAMQALWRSGLKMSNIIDALLLLSSVRRQEEVRVGPLDMAGIVTEAFQRLDPMIEEQQADIVVPDTWPVALGYGPWVEEVWVNYITNAIKYGGRPPYVELGAESRPDGTVCFWVRDNGPGLTPEEQSRLFTPFARLGQARVKGHGLGLSIVSRIVERLGGQAGVESVPGQGSTFTFTLPTGSATDPTRP